MQLHTIAAYYPDQPNTRHRKQCAALISALTTLYPCGPCREDFETEVAKSPPRLESREALSIWLCEQHNLVNTKVGKAEFPCTLHALDERWKTGNASCNGEEF